MRLISIMLASTLLAGCADGNNVADRFAQERAKTVVNGVVQNKFPGVNAAPVSDCIIEAASAGEIISIASASVTGVNQSTVETVLEIGQRPEAVKCITQNSISLLSV